MISRLSFKKVLTVNFLKNKTHLHILKVTIKLTHSDLLEKNTFLWKDQTKKKKKIMYQN